MFKIYMLSDKSNSLHSRLVPLTVPLYPLVRVFSLHVYFFQIAELSDMHEEIMSRVQAGVDQAEVYRSSHASRSHLWTDDRHEFLRQFLKYGHVPTEEEIEAAGTYMYICVHVHVCTALYVHVHVYPL